MDERGCDHTRRLVDGYGHPKGVDMGMGQLGWGLRLMRGERGMDMEGGLAGCTSAMQVSSPRRGERGL